MGTTAGPRFQDRDVLFDETLWRRSVPARSRGRSCRMVSDRPCDHQRQLSSGKNHPQKSQRPDSAILEAIVIALLLLLISAVASPARAQILDSANIYVENQIPANGVSVEYTVSFKNPISHLYDVEMHIRGVR